MSEIYVLDTNTVISAIFWPDSIPAYALAKAQRGTIAITETIVSEWREVINRPKFNKFQPLSVRLATLEELVSNCQLIAVHEFIKACRDPKDDKFLEAAIAANATLIVSGDADLLELNPFRNIPIITARAFIDTE